MFYLFDLAKNTKNYGRVDPLLPPPPPPPTYEYSSDDDEEEPPKSNPQTAAAAPPYQTTATSNSVIQVRGVARDEILSLDRAVDRLGMGAFQYQILIAAGLFMAADSIQSVLLSFLSKSQQLQSVTIDDNQTLAAGRHLVLTQYLSQHDTNRTDTVQIAAEAQAMNDITMVVFPAALMGALVWGMLGDIVGRRPVFVYGAAPLVAICGLGTALVSASPVLSNDWLLLTSFLVAFGVGAVTIPYDLLSEVVSLQHRARCLILLQVFWTVGALLIHLVLKLLLAASNDDDRKTMFIMVPQVHATVDDQIAFEASWQWVVLVVLVVVCAVPCIFATLIGIFAVPESPRWLVAKGHHQSALRILRRAVMINNNNPQQQQRNNDGHESFPDCTILYTHEQPESLRTICSLCASDWMKVTSALWATYFGMAFLDHGTLTLTVSVFSNDARQQDFQGVFRSAAELAGLWLAWWTIDDYGRIMTQQWAYLGGGISCLGIALLITPVTDSDYDNLLLVLAFINRMVVTTGTCATWISTAEVLATEIRTSRHAIAHAVGRLGDYAAQAVFWRMTSLPEIGVVLLAVGIWTTFASGSLPETQAKDMGVGHLPWMNRNENSAWGPTTGRKRNRKKTRSRQNLSPY
ncbi:Synaptic vesicle 2-related protein [Seminavis robusta]|uniref:Synaptic vesicle 2-related protein n=1 Tax=Seminavis robusta TaxID=568900 RepID=A0A9N8EBF9_9STRA|nr:Synaptic vesicle 2-related protein [Seminavis robusta]|eukprot:Sro848_g210450.1 Synaptic vesicle 2-related protein (633) ;mRNA; f:24336-26390